MSISRWIRNRPRSDDNDGLKLRGASLIETSSENSTQISVSKAINGRVLTLLTYRPPHSFQHSSHSDWVTEMYVIKDGESLTDALTMLLVLRGLAE